MAMLLLTYCTFVLFIYLFNIVVVVVYSVPAAPQIKPIMNKVTDIHIYLETMSILLLII